MLRRNSVADAYSKTAEYVAKILQAQTRDLPV